MPAKPIKAQDFILLLSGQLRYDDSEDNPHNEMYRVTDAGVGLWPLTRRDRALMNNQEVLSWAQVEAVAELNFPCSAAELDDWVALQGEGFTVDKELRKQYSRKWLDGVSDALAYGLRWLRDLRPLRHSGHSPAPTPAGDYQSSPRSPSLAAEDETEPPQQNITQISHKDNLSSDADRQCVAGMEDRLQADAETKKDGGGRRRDKQIAALLKIIEKEDMNPHAIPDGGKSKLKRLCVTQERELFTESGFDHAWKTAKKRGEIELKNPERYR